MNISNFSILLQTAFSLYFQQESKYLSLREVPLDGNELSSLIKYELTWEETVVLQLAIMPHLHPQVLDLFFIKNKELDRPYTEFGGWKGNTHNGFLPTGETAAFLLEIDNPENRSLLIQLFSKEHWFHKQNILRLEDQGKGEPFLSGKLCISNEFLAKMFNNSIYHPEYNVDFPAKLMNTNLDWRDLVLPNYLWEDLENISLWIEKEKEICSRWNLNQYFKQGYKCLFYGLEGTGKKLVASLLGKRHGLDVYRVDLSMILSKYIGETEKNISKIFDQAEHKKWILFFDEADILFGKQSEFHSSNDRNNNQTIAYVLQKIEDFRGTVIFAINLEGNLSETISRRFQSVLYFPMPDQSDRMKLWQNMIPEAWLSEDKEELLQYASETKLSGGSIIKVIRRCALELFKSEQQQLTKEILSKALAKK